MRASKLPNVVLPLSAYLAIAVLLPLLNGAYARAGFAHHCGVIVLVCGFLTIAITLARCAVTRHQPRKQRS